MKRIILTVLLLNFLVGCEDITDLNDNPKKAKQAPAGTLFANAEKNLADILATPSVNSGIFRLLAQYWTETTYTNESRYDLSTRNIPQNFWGNVYRDVLNDLEASKIAVNAIDPLFIEESVRKNQIALIEIMEVYSWSLLVDTFGDVPYKGSNLIGEALDVNNTVPKYEDASAIYVDLLLRLDESLKSFDKSAASFGTYDLIYSGEVAKWIVFANSLKLKLGMMLADVDVARAKSVVENAVAAGIFTSGEGNAALKYKDTPPNTNPVWVNLVQSGRKDFVAANTIIDAMNTLNDPRRVNYFTTISGNYVGGKYGSSNSFTKFSKPGDLLKTPTFECLFLDYVEVEFYLAEAKARGFDIDGTVENHYNNAITASMKYWGVSETESVNYLTNTAVAYSSASGNYKEKIGTQKWIALYNRGLEGWTEWRRLDYPQLVAPSTALTVIPLRFTYPVNEQNLNKSNYDAAAAKIGGDNVATKLFWDVN
jgi:hypothetical protein